MEEHSVCKHCYQKYTAFKEFAAGMPMCLKGQSILSADLDGAGWELQLERDYPLPHVVLFPESPFILPSSLLPPAYPFGRPYPQTERPLLLVSSHSNSPEASLSIILDDVSRRQANPLTTARHPYLPEPENLREWVRFEWNEHAVELPPLRSLGLLPGDTSSARSESPASQATQFKRFTHLRSKSPNQSHCGAPPSSTSSPSSLAVCALNNLVPSPRRDRQQSQLLPNHPDDPRASPSPCTTERFWQSLEWENEQNDSQAGEGLTENDSKVGEGNERSASVVKAIVIDEEGVEKGDEEEFEIVLISI